MKITMFIQISSRIAIIEVLILNLKSGEVLIHTEKDELVVSMVRSMGENVLVELIISMIVVKVSILSRIVLIYEVKEKVIVNLYQAVLILEI